MVDEFLALAYYRQKGLPIVICRLFNTVGPRQTGRYGMVIPRFVYQAIHGEPLTVYGNGQQSRCFCDIADVVQALIGLAECPEALGQVFNVGSTQEMTILELAEKVLFLVDSNHPPLSSTEKRIIFVPYEEAYAAGFEDMQRRVPDINKIKNAIRWEPKISLDETLLNIIQGLHSNSNLL
jgi:UDP-glucose 4-epimerase